MKPIRTSRIAPVAEELGFRGVLEGARLLRLLLQKKSNLEIRRAMAQTFGRHWGGPSLEKQYFSLLSSYVLLHHQRDFFAYLRATDTGSHTDQMKVLRPHLTRYLHEKQGLRGASKVLNDLT